MYSCVPGCMYVHHVVTRGYSRKCCERLSHLSNPASVSSQLPALMDTLDSYIKYWSWEVTLWICTKPHLCMLTFRERKRWNQWPCESGVSMPCGRLSSDPSVSEAHLNSMSLSGEAAAPQLSHVWPALESYIYFVRSPCRVLSYWAWATSEARFQHLCTHHLPSYGCPGTPFSPVSRKGNRVLPQGHMT